MRPLITADELAPRLAAGDVTVLDVRWSLGGPPGRAAYEAGHVPGAVFVDLDTDLARPAGTHGRHPLPDAREFGAAMRRCGVSSTRAVVCYDEADSTAAARAWWLLEYFGHPDARVLDGGYAAWVASGRATSADIPRPSAGDFEPIPGQLRLVDATGAAAVARSGRLLDARSAVRYRGEQEPVDPVAGHIPGAVSAPVQDSVDESGEFRTSDELRARFEALGATDSTDVAAYCGSGVVATHHVLALRLAGVEAALYADSWSGWITDPERPVATGEHPG